MWSGSRVEWLLRHDGDDEQDVAAYMSKLAQASSRAMPHVFLPSTCCG